MAQANVYTSVSDQAWYTDKALIATGNTAVTYNVNAVSLGQTVKITGSTVNGNTTLTFSPGPYAYITSGSGIAGNGIPGSTTVSGVTYVNSTTATLTLSQAATATTTNDIFTVSIGAVGNIYSNAVSIPAFDRQYVYVGVGNKLTITGVNFTAEEAGTDTSATAGVIGVGSGV